MRRKTNLRNLGGIFALTFTTVLTASMSSASAVDGTEVSGSVGVWAPLLPELHDSSGDSIGTILGLSGHHRFNGYRTSVETDVNFGITDDTEMFGFDALLRDTWTFGDHGVSAGFGYSQMNWEQEAGSHEIDSNYYGAKAVAGWETICGRTPIWLDLSLGLYDLDGSYKGGAGPVVKTGSISEFTTTYGAEFKTDFNCLGIPSRAVFGVNYIDDFTTWQNGEIGTDDAVVLTGAIEFRLF